MSNLQAVLEKQQWRDLSLRRQEDEITEKLFQHQRNSLIAIYAQSLRVGAMIDSLRREVEEWNASAPTKFTRPALDWEEAPREWFNAAILLLTHTDEETQKQFLTLSDSRRDLLVQAVLDDSGIVTHDTGSWQEIPE